MSVFKSDYSSLNCYHCGEPCELEQIEFEEKQFCCQGCKTVYEILSQNDLCDYYQLEQMPGISPKVKSSGKFDLSLIHI